MSQLVAYLLLFLAVGVFFVFIHLMMGKVIRPSRPDPEKQTIYECGEPTIGSAWIQFDLRFYVVALLFVIFDVEVVFFFPWAVVFGKANRLADPALPTEVRQTLTDELVPASLRQTDNQLLEKNRVIDAKGASDFAWIAFWDIAVFFSVLLVGFAYLWKRGDLDWVRSTAAEESALRGSTAVPAPVPESKPMAAAS